MPPGTRGQTHTHMYTHTNLLTDVLHRIDFKTSHILAKGWQAFSLKIKIFEFKKGVAIEYRYKKKGNKEQYSEVT